MTTELMTKEQLLQEPWAVALDRSYELLNGEVLEPIAIQYDPIVNWYAFSGFGCPIDGTEWSWKYDTEGVHFTSSALPLSDLEGFQKIADGHRVIVGKCGGPCGETYYIHNFDHGV